MSFSLSVVPSLLFFSFEEDLCQHHPVASWCPGRLEGRVVNLRRVCVCVRMCGVRERQRKEKERERKSLNEGLS